MHEIFDPSAGWFRQGKRFALVTITKVFGSAPRLPGVAMAVADTGEVVGSVSGGCIEGAVYEEALQVLEGSVPSRCSYGITDEDAFAVGLTCGGDIDVFIEPIDATSYPAFLDVVEAVTTGEPVAVATVITGADTGRHFVVRSERPSDATASEAVVPARLEGAVRAMLVAGRTGLLGGDPDIGDATLFVESFQSPPKLLIFGATDFARALVAAGKLLGYHATICDAREVFTTCARFPDADEIVVEQPFRHLAAVAVDERTVICVLTHDPKFDVPLLEVALRGPAGYIGALGSRRTHEDRLRRLRDAGVHEHEIARLRSPIGLDLGASTPQETAVSILAEVIASRHGASGRPLTTTAGRIHV